MNVSIHFMPKHNLIKDILIGSASGTAATIPMTAAMELLRYATLRSKAGTFPPRQVALGMIEQAGLKKALRPFGEPGLIAITTATHFGFGGVAGGLYGMAMSLLQRRGPGSSSHSTDKPKPNSKTKAAAIGACFGLGVWTSSYFGWLPALGIIKPQGDFPIRKNIILGCSHLVWGAATGLLFHQLEQRKSAAPAPRNRRNLPPLTRRSITRALSAHHRDS
jgi:hypothetical protein